MLSWKNSSYPRSRSMVEHLNVLCNQGSINFSHSNEETFVPLFTQSTNSYFYHNHQSTRTKPLVKRSTIMNRQHPYKQVVSTFNSQRPKTTGNTNQQIRKQKMRQLLKVQNLRKTVSNNRKALTAQNYRHKIKSEGKNRHQDAKDIGKVEGTLLTKQEPNNRMRYSSSVFELGKQQVKFYNYRQQAKQLKKDYLKKGSSINRGVLNTIIKLKLGRNAGDALEDQVKNQDILKMIKVYKGTVKYPSEKERVLEKVQPNKRERGGIMGWQHQTDQFPID